MNDEEKKTNEVSPVDVIIEEGLSDHIWRTTRSHCACGEVNLLTWSAWVSHVTPILADLLGVETLTEWGVRVVDDVEVLGRQLRKGQVFPAGIHETVESAESLPKRFGLAVPTVVVSRQRSKISYVVTEWEEVSYGENEMA